MMRNARPSTGPWLAVLAAGVLMTAIVPASSLRAESVASLVDEGNRLFRERHFKEALEKYRQAQKIDPASPAIRYNIGNALSQLGQPDKAYDEYRQAFGARERALAEGARYNAGNTHLSRGNWQEAIRNYQEALRLDPADQDAKKNLELALNKLEEERRKQRQQQQRNQQQGQPPPKGEKEDSSDRQNQGEKKDQDRGDQDRQPSGGTPREEKQQGASTDQKLSRDEAMRLLEAMKSQDRGPRNPIRTPPPDRRPEKDW